MEFYIKKGATLNVLKMELIKDGRNDFNKFFELIQNATITFTMTDVVTGVKRIACRPAGTQLVLPVSCVGEEYYLTFQFTSAQTSKVGRYVGSFDIELLAGMTGNTTGTLIVPIREELYINILDQGIKK